MNLSSLSKLDKIGQFFFPAAYINDNEKEVKKIEKLILDYKIGGITFFHSRASTITNFDAKQKIIENKDSAKRLGELITHYQSISTTPLLICIDAEWGLAMRVEYTPQYPYAITLGALPAIKNDLIYEVGKAIGYDLISSGIHLNLAPVVDINTNPKNPVIGYRSFGEDKKLVTTKSLLYINGLKESGVLGCIKHFPGHGDTAIDSHIGLPMLTKSKQEFIDLEFYPFQKAIDAQIDTVMIGHIATPSLSDEKNTPATLSKTVIKTVLRDEMKFEGVVISDALNMHSVSKLYTEKGMLEWKAFDAGNDILCFSEHVDEGIKTIAKNATDKQIEESIARLQNLKKQIHLKPSKSSFKNEDVLNTEIAKASITLYKGNNNQESRSSFDNFSGITLGSKTNCSFFDEIKNHKDIILVKKDTDIQTDHIIIALFPPSIKPANAFGIEQKDITFINKLSKIKKVTLYLFGNPYALKLLQLESIDTVILAYQEFDTFQKVAASHFLGKQKLIGQCPVHL